jgi:hypothetical protein
MAVPTTKDEFKEFCLRRLGKPVIEINVSDDQVDDRVDEAMAFWKDFHFDATEKTYFKHQVVSADIDNKYITLPANIIGAVRIFPISDPSVRQDDLFNIRYQIALNDLYTLTSVSMVPYYMTMQHLGIFEEILVGQQPIRFNRKNNILHIDQDWNNVRPGEFILVEAFQVVDPATYTSIWGDRQLMKLATAYIQLQWASNLMKFANMQLPGNVSFNAQALYAEALRKIDDAEREIHTTYELPTEMMIG